MNHWRVPFDINTIKIPHGNVHILVERCKGCAFCEEYCPKDVLEMSSEFNRKGYHYPVVVKHNSCVNCNLCETICPEFAIFVNEDQARHPEADEVLQKGEKS